MFLGMGYPGVQGQSFLGGDYNLAAEFDPPLGVGTARTKVARQHVIMSFKFVQGIVETLPPVDEPGSKMWLKPPGVL